MLKALEVTARIASRENLEWFTRRAFIKHLDFKYKVTHMAIMIENTPRITDVSAAGTQAVTGGELTGKNDKVDLHTMGTLNNFHESHCIFIWL